MTGAGHQLVGRCGREVVKQHAVAAARSWPRGVRVQCGESWCLDAGDRVQGRPKGPVGIDKVIDLADIALVSDLDRNERLSAQRW